MMKRETMNNVLQCLLLVSMVTVLLSQDTKLDPSQICLVVPPSVEDCYKSYTDKPVTERAAQVACLQQLLWHFEPLHFLSDADLRYFRDLRGAGPDPNSTYIPNTALPPSGYRVRREFRTLSDGERRRFHDALNKLYQDGVIRRFAELYSQASHFHQLGASFLPWNRVFLVMFEEALRKVDPHVFLPYWDSTLDDAMDNPVNSELWIPKYFGTGTGDVTSGLGAGWVTHQGNLQRDYGRKSRLMTKDQLGDILSQCHLKDISRPTSRPQFDIELFHGGPHAWVGGDMAYPATAGYDPIFYLHQAYVDYVWELFRLTQSRRCGVSGASDYPEVAEGDSHHPAAPMIGFDWLTNRDGIQNYWNDNWYTYVSHPYCRNCCPSCQSPLPLFCDTSKNVCVSRSRRVFPPSTDPTTISAKDEFLNMAEITALTSTRAPRNRGIEYDHPLTDGRTLATANIDAARANHARIISQRAWPQPLSGADPNLQRTGPRGSFSGMGRSSFGFSGSMPSNMFGGSTGDRFSDRGPSFSPISPFLGSHTGMRPVIGSRMGSASDMSTGAARGVVSGRDMRTIPANMQRTADSRGVRTGSARNTAGRWDNMVSDIMGQGGFMRIGAFTKVDASLIGSARMRPGAFTDQGTGTRTGRSDVSSSGAFSGGDASGGGNILGRESANRRPETGPRGGEGNVVGGGISNEASSLGTGGGGAEGNHLGRDIAKTIDASGSSETTETRPDRVTSSETSPGRSAESRINPDRSDLVIISSSTLDERNSRVRDKTGRRNPGRGTEKTNPGRGTGKASRRSSRTSVFRPDAVRTGSSSVMRETSDMVM